MCGNNEDGYSLIELMVVILILAILFSLAVVTYAAVRDKGFDAEAQVNLHNGVSAAKAYYAGNNASYNGLSADELARLAGGLNFKDGLVVTENDVYVSDVTTAGYVLRCRSMSGRIFTATGQHLQTTYSY